MTRDEYLKAVREDFYQGEVLGEAFFSAALAGETDPDRRWKLGCLLQIETETKAKLRPFLARLGLPIEEEDPTPRIAAGLESWRSAASWRDRMETLFGALDHFLARYRAIEADAPPSEVEVARAMVRHETAIKAFVERELAGDPRSLDPVLAELAHPLPEPAMA